MKKQLRAWITVLLLAAFFAALSLPAAADAGIVNEIKDAGDGGAGESTALNAAAQDRKQSAAPVSAKNARQGRLPAGARYVDLVRFRFDYEDPSSPTLVVLLGANGKLKLGENADSFFGEDQLRRLRAWTDVVEIEACGSFYNPTLAGLKKDGTLVWETRDPGRNGEKRCVLEDWSGVVRLYGDGANNLYGLTESGRLLIWDNEGIFDDEYVDLTSWSGVRELAPYAYPAGCGAFGIREDGSLAALNTFLQYCTYTYKEVEDGIYELVESSLDWTEKVDQVSTTGYLSAFLDPAGRVRAFGMYSSADFQAGLEELSGVKRIAATTDGVACLMPDGSVRYVIGEDRGPTALSAADSWKNVTDIQAADHLLAALHKNGRVSLAMLFGEKEEWVPEPFAQIYKTVKSWRNVAAIEVLSGGSEPLILAWQKDGTLLAAGLELTK